MHKRSNVGHLQQIKATVLYPRRSLRCHQASQLVRARFDRQPCLQSVLGDDADVAHIEAGRNRPSSTTTLVPQPGRPAFCRRIWYYTLGQRKSAALRLGIQTSSTGSSNLCAESLPSTTDQPPDSRRSIVSYPVASLELVYRSSRFPFLDMQMLCITEELGNPNFIAQAL